MRHLAGSGSIARLMVLFVAVGVSAVCDDSGPSGGDEGPRTRVVVVNETSLTCISVNISPCADDVWGRDWLGSGTLGPGEERSFDVDPGCYDLRAIFQGVSVASFGYQIVEGQTLRWVVTIPDLTATPARGGARKLR